MNYRHAYHAGNFADVLKHVVLTALVDRLTQKDKPFAVLDVHAGRGRYALGAAAARRTNEHASGIARLWAACDDAPPLTRRYLELVRAENACAGASGEAPPLDVYPGSPLLVSRQLRAADRLQACELEAGEHAALAALLRTDRRVAVHRRDAWEALGALLPPREKRGLVLIDPPYEPPAAEQERAIAGLREVRRRFANGIVALWYPIKDGAGARSFLRRLAAPGLGEALVVELCVWPDDTRVRMNGSGMLIVNPPWQFEVALAAELPWLWQHLANDGLGRYTIERLGAA
ncbi:MAG: 23S rRNA (adenine(2030)-N(6))-methyltransferase RlmJ [Gammaproteobacteria bacterium]